MTESYTVPPTDILDASESCYDVCAPDHDSLRMEAFHLTCTIHVYYACMLHTDVCVCVCVHVLCMCVVHVCT